MENIELKFGNTVLSIDYNYIKEEDRDTRRMYVQVIDIVDIRLVSGNLAEILYEGIEVGELEEIIQNEYEKN